MTMIGDLLKAAIVTLIVASPLLFGSEETVPKGRWELPIVLFVLAVSILGGIAVLARRHREQIVPIASIYSVVMLGLLLWLAFTIGWYQGRVEM